MTEFEIRNGVLVKFNGIGDVVKIPTGVKVIADNCFAEDPFVCCVALSDTVREIGAGAFAECPYLKEVDLRSVEKIGDFAFSECPIREISLPDTLTEMGEGAFYASAIRKLYVPGTLKRIDVSAFAWSGELAAVTIGEGVEEIGKEALAHCDGLNTVVVPDSIRSIHPEAFVGCTQIQRVEASEGWKAAHPELLCRILISATSDAIVDVCNIRIEKDTDTVQGYDGGKKTLSIPNAIIGKNAFAHNAALEQVELTGTIEIGMGAFHGCKNLKKASFPHVQRIGMYAFCQTALEDVKLPTTLVELSSAAFREAKLKAVTIPGTVKTVESLCFSVCSELRRVKLCHGVEALEAYAFSHCGLLELEIPDTLSRVHPDAFRGTKIKRVIASDKWKAEHPDLLARIRGEKQC